MALADWDPRLLSPERALTLAGDWPIYATFELAPLSEQGSQPDQWQINLRCRKCQQSCGMLSKGTYQGKFTSSETSIGDLLSGVVRHMVTAHDLSLSGAGRVEPAPDDGTGPLIVSPSEDHVRLIDAITKEQSHG